MDRLAEFGLGVGIEIGGRVKRDPSEQAVDRAAADARELCQRFGAARNPPFLAQIIGSGCCAAGRWVALTLRSSANFRSSSHKPMCEPRAYGTNSRNSNVNFFSYFIRLALLSGFLRRSLFTTTIWRPEICELSPTAASARRQ